VSSVLSRLHLLNWRYVAGHRLRSILSCGVIASSAALIVAVFGTYGSVSGSADRLSEQVAGNAALEITGITDSGVADSWMGILQSTDGVAAAVPLVQAPILIDGRRVMLYGSDEHARKLSSALRRAIDDVPRDNNARPGLWIGPAVTGAKEGDVTRVVSTNGSTLQVPIAGTIPGANAATVNHGNLAIAELHLAEELVGRPHRLDSVLIVAAHGTDISALQKRLSQRLDGHAYVATPAFRAALANSSTAMAKNVTLLVALLGLVVTAFLVFNTMNMAANERRAEMATLRALGARRATIMSDFLFESFIVGLVGAAVGSLCGVGMAAAAVSRLPPLLLTALDVNVEFVLPPTAIPIALVACIGATLLAAGLAAYRVSRVPPVAAMRPADQTMAETPSARTSTPFSTWAALGLGALVGSAGVAVSVTSHTNWALAGTALLLAGVALIAYAATTPIVYTAAAVSRLLGAPGHLAAASVERATRRTWATTMTVCLAVAIGVATTGTSQNVVAAAGEAVSPLGRIDYMVQTTPGDEFPFRQLLPLEIGQQIRRIPGVDRVVAGQFAYANMLGGRTLLQGLSGPSNTPAYQLASDTARRALLDGTGAVVSTLFAKQHGLSVGQMLALPTPNGEKRLKVVDVVNFVSADAGLVAIGLDELQQWFARPGASFYEVMALPHTDAPELRAALERIVRAIPFPVYVMSGSDMVAATESAVQQIGALASALQWIVALVAALAVLNTLMLAVVERKRELGILRALGASRRFVSRMIFADAVGVSVVGAATGVTLGVLLQCLSVTVLGKIAALSVSFAFVPLAAEMAAGAMMIALIGALPPARAAGRLQVIESIGYE
jgi:putative ABC transport system permease protein